MNNLFCGKKKCSDDYFYFASKQTEYPTAHLTTLCQLHYQDFVLNNDETLVLSLLVRDVYKVMRKWLNASTF